MASTLRWRRLLFRRRVAQVVRAIAVPVVVVLGVRVVWGWEAAWRLRSVERDLRAQGIPHRREEFLDAPIPDDRNAVVPFLQALRDPLLSGADQDFLSGADKERAFAEIQFSGEEQPRVDALLKKLAPVFAKAESAMRLPAIAWPAELFSDDYSRIAPSHIFQARALANDYYDAALRASERHDAGETLRCLAMVLSISRLCDTLPTAVIHIDRAMPIRALAAAGVERMLPDMHLTSETLPAARALIATLADTSELIRRNRRTFEAEGRADLVVGQCRMAWTMAARTRCHGF